MSDISVIAEGWLIAARFWAKADVGSKNQCWTWRGGLVNGYSTIRINGKTRRGAQVAWELASGAGFPAGMEACHRCDNPACVNPEHIFVGTHHENMKDMSAKGRHSYKAATHCKHGHEYTPENTITKLRDGSIRRICRTCGRSNTEAWRKKQKARDACGGRG